MTTLGWSFVGTVLFCNVILALIIALSLRHRAVGTITLIEQEDGTKTYLFEVHGDTDDLLAHSEEVLFKVVH
jgi:hypothetical protein